MSSLAPGQLFTLLSSERWRLLGLRNTVPHVFDKLDLLRWFQAGESLEYGCRAHE